MWVNYYLFVLVCGLLSEKLLWQFLMLKVICSVGLNFLQRIVDCSWLGGFIVNNLVLSFKIIFGVERLILVGEFGLVEPIHFGHLFLATYVLSFRSIRISDPIIQLLIITIQPGYIRIFLQIQLLIIPNYLRGSIGNLDFLFMALIFVLQSNFPIGFIIIIITRRCLDR